MYISVNAITKCLQNAENDTASTLVGIVENYYFSFYWVINTFRLRTDYNWTRRKKNDSTNKVKLCKGRIWKKVGDVYEYYNPLKNEAVKWCQLKIHATRGLNEKCAVCNSYVGHDSIDFSTKPCGHRYHNSCFEKIKDILKRECPACYNN